MRSPQTIRPFFGRPTTSSFCGADPAAARSQRDHRGLERRLLYRRRGVDARLRAQGCDRDTTISNCRERHFHTRAPLRRTRRVSRRALRRAAPAVAGAALRNGRSCASFRVAAELRAAATFRRLNLVESYSWPRRFPVIFCRNVMIYFDSATQEKVVGGLSECLEPGGYLFVGHAESLSRISHPLEYVRPAIYRKPAERRGRWNRSS